MYSEKTKFYTHPELGVQTVALKNGQVYFIPKDFTGRFGYKCNDALVRRLCKGQQMLMVPVGPDTRKMRKVLGVPCHEALAIINDIAHYITEKEAYRLWFDEILLDFMKPEFDLKEELLKCIHRYHSNGGATFTNMERNFDRYGYNYQGDCSLVFEAVGGGQPVYFWSGWNKETFEALAQLVEEGRIQRRYTGPLPYYYEGRALSLPVIHDIDGIAAGGWLPIGFTITPAGEAELEAA